MLDVWEINRSLLFPSFLHISTCFTVLDNMEEQTEIREEKSYVVGCSTNGANRFLKIERFVFHTC
jgi:hypothetical protein